MKEIKAPTNDSSDAVEYVKFAAVILIIIIASYAGYMLSSGSVVMDFLRIFMGVFMMVFASFKFIGYKMFVMMFPTYDIVAKRFKIYASLYPFIEFELGLLHVLNLLPGVTSIAVIVLMGVSSIGVFNEIRKKKAGQIHCACLGNIIKLPLSTVSMVENVSMVIMAIVMLAL